GAILGPGEESVSMAAFRERRVVQDLEPPDPARPAATARTRLAVPLIARDEVLGVALVLDEHARSFTRPEMDRALAVAGQLALALLSARLYEALRSSYAELARAQSGDGRQRVAVTVRVAEDAATVRADARLLRQALVNLFLNAYQAMPRTGRLEVRASRSTIDSRPFAEIVVRDSGPGIPPDVVDKIFKPFFTTKAMGTGLGLAVVRRIVEHHGGTIELGRLSPGAEFKLRLPLEAQNDSS